MIEYTLAASLALIELARLDKKGILMDIYYFTGTGNCLAAARRLAKNLGGRLVSIADAAHQPTIQTKADIIGIVFPAYLSALHGVPMMVEGFVRRLEGLESKRLYAVCTCGGYELVNAVPALRSINRFVRGQDGRLAGEYSLRLPMNNLDYEHIPVPIETDSNVIIARAEGQIDAISRRIAQGRQGKAHLARRLFTVLMAPLYALMAQSTLKSLRELAIEPADSTLGFRELIPLTDKSIRVDEKCNGCGVCTRVCPAKNIKLADKRPAFQHRCEMCFACDEWCPQAAVHHWGRPNGEKYHHPAVHARDLFSQQDGYSPLD